MLEQWLENKQAWFAIVNHVDDFLISPITITDGQSITARIVDGLKFTGEDLTKPNWGLVKELVCQWNQQPFEQCQMLYHAKKKYWLFLFELDASLLQ